MYALIECNYDGCIRTRSNEAKALDIPMGAPAFEYRYIFERCDVNIFSANFTLYGDMSSRVMSILSDYSPDQKIYSTDECFLDVTGILHDLTEHGLKTRQHVLKWAGNPELVGNVPIKSLSKVADKKHLSIIV